MITRIIIFIFLVTACFSEDVQNNDDLPFKGISEIKSLFPGKALKQTQYEVDLNGGHLWIYNLYLIPDKNSFLITVYVNSDKSILLFEEGKKVNLESLYSGYALINGVAYKPSSTTENWEKTEIKPIINKLKRFDYFTLDTCPDYQDDMLVLKSKEASIKDSNKEIGLFDSSTSNPTKKEFYVDKYKIDISTALNNFITRWAVSDHSVLLRLITNDIVQESEISLPILSTSNEFILPKNTNSLFKSIENKPGLGIFYVKLSDGKFSIQAVAKNSPADQAGIKVGDVIIQINNKSLEGLDLQGVKNIIDESLVVKILLKTADGKILDKVIEKKLLNFN